MELWSESSRGRALVIGMVHLRALRGSPGFEGDAQKVMDAALRDAEALAGGGIDAIMLENFGDAPFYPARVPAHVVAEMTAVACRIKERVKRPLGINVLRNDGLSALAVAAASGASFIRVNVLCGARVADQGILAGIAHDLLRERVSLGAQHVKILADVDVKHSAPLAHRPIEDEVEDTIHRGRADAVIVSGSGTGKATAVEKVACVKQAAGNTPVLVGSGIAAETVAEYLPIADGFIVGTSLKDDEGNVDAMRVKELMRMVRGF